MIGIVVVHYEDPASLALVLDALEGAENLGADLRVVVADDGSATPPDLGSRPYPVRVVAQEDRGFRAAAARNLGARALLADGPVESLLFLDGDTVPSPGYVARLHAALQRAAASAPGRRALAVGRRRYADLADLSAGQVHTFLATPDPARVLPDTAWLDVGYAETENLARADDRSYRFVISATLAVTPELFTAAGGFDESFVGYGGEDWEFAQRAWLAGADLVHEPAALAWHDGPDAAGRDDRALAGGADPEVLRRRATAETMRVAGRITEPGARDAGLFWEHPDVLVELDDTGWAVEDVLLTCADLVRDTDARVWLRDGELVRSELWPRLDPRVSRGPAPDTVRARARFRVRVEQPVRLTRSLADLCRQAPLHAPGLHIVHSRHLARGAPTPPQRPHPDVRTPRRPISLEAEWGWRTPDSLDLQQPDDKEHR